MFTSPGGWDWHWAWFAESVAGTALPWATSILSYDLRNKGLHKSKGETLTVSETRGIKLQLRKLMKP